MAHSPSLAAGAVLFDLWICNADRHSANLAFDSAQGRMMLFDHSHALFASADIDSWLLAQTGTFNIGGHCLAPHLTQASDFPMWSQRLASIPSYFIEGLVDDAVAVGLPTSKAQACKDFLLHRRGEVLQLVKANGPAFPNIPAAQWALIEE